MVRGVGAPLPRPRESRGLDASADGGEPARLDEQDGDDGGAVAEAGGHTGGDATTGGGVGEEGQRVAVALQHDGQRRDEQGAGEGPAGGTDAADDDHGEELDGEEHAEGLRHDVAEGEGEQHAAEPGEHRRHEERRPLGPGHVDAEDRGRDLAVAHRVQRPPRPARLDVAVEEEAHDDGGEADVPELLDAGERHAEHVQGRARRVVDGEAEQLERRHVAAVEAAGERLGVEQHVLAEEDEAERGDAEVDAAQPGRDRAEDEPGHSGGHDREHDGDERREAQAGLRAHADVAGLRREVRVAVGADGEEEGVGEGELAGLADEEVEAEGGDHGGEGEHADLEPEGVEVEGRDEGAADEEESGDEVRAQVDAAGGAHRRHVGGEGELRHASPPSCRTARSGGRGGRRP